MSLINNSLITQLKSLAADRMSVPTFIIDNRETMVYANPAATRLFMVAGDCQGRLLVDFLQHVVNRTSILATIRHSLTGNIVSEMATLFMNSREYHGTIKVLPVLHRAELAWCIVTFEDQSAYVRLQQRLTREEFFDLPTGLLNRKTLEIMVELELEKASRSPETATLALMVIHIRNLENLRAVYHNDTVNLMLEHLGNSVRTALRSVDLLFRYDDNRILAVITNFKLKTDLLIIAERVEDQIAIPFHEKDMHLHLQSVIGISVFPEDGTTTEKLRANALSALNHAIEEGQPWLMFNHAIHERARDRLELRSGLSQAVRNNELELRYMSLVDAKGTIRGAEALVRWKHPMRGLLGPDTFLPVAIHSRIIGAITRWVLFRAIKDWEDTLSDWDIFITINLSALDFKDDFFLDTIKTATANHIPPGRLKVEITEHECIENIERVTTVMHELAKVGIDVLIDDFGVGQSSLSYLKDLPAHYAKVDRAFLSTVAHNESDRTFLGHIISLAKVRGINILLEGVEDGEQFEALKSCGADLFQGHWFGEPMKLDDFAALLEGSAPRMPS